MTDHHIILTDAQLETLNKALETATDALLNGMCRDYETAQALSAEIERINDLKAHCNIPEHIDLGAIDRWAARRRREKEADHE